MALGLVALSPAQVCCLLSNEEWQSDREHTHKRHGGGLLGSWTQRKHNNTMARKT